MTSDRPASDLGPPPCGPGPGGRRQVPETSAPPPSAPPQPGVPTMHLLEGGPPPGGPGPGAARPRPVAYRRPRTGLRVDDFGDRFVTVQRTCNGCHRPIGDMTDGEAAAAIAGQPQPDVIAECPFCTPDTRDALAELRTSYEAMTALAWDAITDLRARPGDAQVAALHYGARFRELNDTPTRSRPVDWPTLMAYAEERRAAGHETGMTAGNPEVPA